MQHVMLTESKRPALLDGDVELVMFEAVAWMRGETQCRGVLRLTSHRVIWFGVNFATVPDDACGVALSRILSVENPSGWIGRSSKVVLHLIPQAVPATPSPSAAVQFVFQVSAQLTACLEQLQLAMQRKSWEQQPVASQKAAAFTPSAAGISGLIRRQVCEEGACLWFSLRPRRVCIIGAPDERDHATGD